MDALRESVAQSDRAVNGRKPARRLQGKAATTRMIAGLKKTICVAAVKPPAMRGCGDNACVFSVAGAT